eukprot:9439581-Alexandrium_andersonii.AAC.1
MSASLVGSEMCIRDSLAGGPGPGVAPEPAPEPGPRSSLAPGAAAGPAPVSYTHLTLPTICSV